MNKIGVFLSASEGLPEAYVRAAEAVGELIGRTGRTLVYGGSRRGLMEVLARSVKEHGGRVYGVVPDIVAQRGLESQQTDVTFRCADLNDRKAVMMRESEVLVALPGGLGTLDEAFTVLAADAIGLADKTVILYNVENCWTPLLNLLDSLQEQGLVSRRARSNLRVVSDIASLEALI